MITLNDLVEDVVAKYPKTVRVFMAHSFPCLVCGEPVWGTIGENADRNALKPEQQEKLIQALNEAVDAEEP